MRILHGTEPSLRAVAERRARTHDESVERSVRTIFEEVAARGDEALRDLAERFDGVRPAALRVPGTDLEAAERQVAPDLRDAIDRAIERIERFHQRQPTGGHLETEADGALLGQLVRPLERVGVYVPAGTAPLFSTLLMTAVPARVAGVERIVVATPPGPGGGVAPEILVAARRVGVDTVVTAGGAQAIAALTFGTETVPGVDKILGPGNRFVVAAKRLAFGRVGIESLPGPTETLVLADDGAEPRHVAADLLAQAEHADAEPVLVTPHAPLADAVSEAQEALLADLPTADTARASLRRNGLTCIVEDLAGAFDVANAYAPEHLCLLLRAPWRWLPRVRHAGGVFLGAFSMEALGDYVAGPSHVMPTGGTARYASAVNVRDFQKVIPLVSLAPETVREVGPAAVTMARAEGLEAHARAVETRLGDV